MLNSTIIVLNLEFENELKFYKLTSRPDHVCIKSYFNIHLLVSSADNFCQPIGPRSGLTKCQACSGFNLFDTQMVFLKEFYEKKNDFEKVGRQQKKHEKFLKGQK